MTFGEQRSALLAMAAQWRIAAKCGTDPTIDNERPPGIANLHIWYAG
jgi:hypothetical protein